MSNNLASIMLFCRNSSSVGSPASAHCSISTSNSFGILKLKSRANLLTFLKRSNTTSGGDPAGRGVNSHRNSRISNPDAQNQFLFAGSTLSAPSLMGLKIRS